jgi:acyl-CoA hydrolase
VLALASLMGDDPERFAGLRFVSCLVPGMNEQLDYAGIAPGCSATTFMLPAVLRPSFSEGRVDLIPRTYSGAGRFLRAAALDVVIAHVAPPDRDGGCSLGIASDFAPLVWRSSACRVMIVNPRMPPMKRGPRLALSDADVVVETESPLIESPTPVASPEADAIAARIAAMIPDDAHIQTGIGGAPGALWKQLRSHRGLVLRSGMANDWIRDLAECGALAAHGHFAGIAYGSADFYRFLGESDLVSFGTTEETHGYGPLAAVPRLHSVNGALEVDLFGQVNVEWQGERLGSGTGGAPDFMRAAAASEGGRSFVALPATAKGGSVSRIVPRLGRPSTSIARSDIDTVVTEHGVAELRDKGLDARAEALLAIAAPAFRDSLAAEWHSMRRLF